MGTELSQLPGTDTLAELAQRIRFKEQAGFELVTLARGQIEGQPVNLATFHDLPAGADPGNLTLVTVAGALSLVQQGTALVAAAKGRRLVSYAEVFVQSREANVAAFRG